MNIKPRIGIDLSSTGAGGGPYTSNLRVMSSNLKEKYEFVPFIYKTEIGRFISFKRIKDLKKQLVKSKPDLVHFSGLQLMGFHIAVACKLAGVKKTVVTVHGLSSDALNISWVKKTILTFFLEPFTIFLASKVYGVSEFVSNRKMLRLFKRKNLGFIYNLPSSIKKVDTTISIRNELGIDSSAKVAITVGRIIQDKGYHILDEVILKCQDKSDLKFIIVGDGCYLNKMKEKLKYLVDKKQVFFLGYRSDVQNLLSECDFFILPTLHETLSIALLEASQASLPLIASKTGGVPEIVKHNVNGVLVEPGSIQELLQAVNKLYKNDELRKDYGEKAKQLLELNFNPLVIESQINKVYQDLLISK